MIDIGPNLTMLIFIGLLVGLVGFFLLLLVLSAGGDDRQG